MSTLTGVDIFWRRNRDSLHFHFAEVNPLFPYYVYPSTSLRDAAEYTWILPRTNQVSTGHLVTLPLVGSSFRIPQPPSKKFHTGWCGTFLAEQQGFEPWRHFHALRDFESRLFDQLEYCSIFTMGILYQPWN